MREGSHNPRWALASGATHAVPQVRRDIVAHLRRHAQPQADLDSCAVVISELLGNAVQHSPGEVEVEVSWSQDGPWLHVRDEGAGPSQAHAQLPQDVLAEHGRGMYLVSSLSVDVLAAPRRNGGSEVSVLLDVLPQARQAVVAAVS